MVTHQLQVERRTGKVRRPETDVLPLSHATNVCMDRPIYGIIIGNVEGVRDVPDDKEMSDTELHSQSKVDNAESQTVVTRQQSKLKVTRPLHVPAAVDLSTSARDLVKLQAEDDSLNSVRQKIQPYSGSEEGHGTYFFQDKQLLYRLIIMKKRGVSRKQLVLPKTLCDGMMKIAHESTFWQNIMEFHELLLE